MKQIKDHISKDTFNLNIFYKVVMFFKKHGQKSAILVATFFLFKGILWLIGAGAVLNFFNFF